MAAFLVRLVLAVFASGLTFFAGLVLGVAAEPNRNLVLVCDLVMLPGSLALFLWIVTRRSLGHQSRPRPSHEEEGMRNSSAGDQVFDGRMFARVADLEKLENRLVDIQKGQRRLVLWVIVCAFFTSILFPVVLAIVL